MTNSSNLRSGLIVDIFEDPITCQKLEGKAKLISEYRPDEGDGLSMWIVRFPEDSEEYLRTININQQPEGEQ